MTRVNGNSRRAESSRTAYIVPGLKLELRPRFTEKIAKSVRLTTVGVIPSKPKTLRLNVGDALVLTRSLDPDQPSKYDKKKQLTSPVRIGATLREFLDCVHPGEPIWFDDGKIGGTIRTVTPRM